MLGRNLTFSTKSSRVAISAWATPRTASQGTSQWTDFPTGFSGGFKQLPRRLLKRLLKRLLIGVPAIIASLFRVKHIPKLIGILFPPARPRSRTSSAQHIGDLDTGLLNVYHSFHVLGFLRSYLHLQIRLEWRNWLEEASKADIMLASIKTSGWPRRIFSF